MPKKKDYCNFQNEKSYVGDRVPDRVIVGVLVITEEVVVVGIETRSAADAAKLDINSRTAAEGLAGSGGGFVAPKDREECNSDDSFVALLCSSSRTTLSRFSNELLCGGGRSTRIAANSRNRLLISAERPDEDSIFGKLTLACDIRRASAGSKKREEFKNF
jgi:hypothetical protein